MKSTKIAFVIHGLVPGGAEKFFIDLVNYFFQSGTPLIVILLSDQNPRIAEIDKDVKYYVINRKHKYDFGVSSRIRKTILTEQVGTVFCVNTFSFFFVKAAFLFDKKLRFFLSLHSTIPSSFKDFVANFIYFRFAGKRDEALFICRNQKEYLKKRYFFNPAISRVIYNGINTAYFTPCSPVLGDTSQKAFLRQKYNIADTEKIIVNAARIAPEKGHLFAVEALGILHEKYKVPAYLFFVGNGDEEYLKTVKEAIARSGLEKHVFFAGYQKDVRPFYCLSDLFTLTSYTIETFSLAALEAMSSGLPCSLTEIGGASEMITERSGVLCRPSDAASTADSWYQVFQRKYDPQDLHNYIAANFSLEKMLEGYREALQ